MRPTLLALTAASAQNSRYKAGVDHIALAAAVEDTVHTPGPVFGAVMAHCIRIFLWSFVTWVFNYGFIFRSVYICFLIFHHIIYIRGGLIIHF